MKIKEIAKELSAFVRYPVNYTGYTTQREEWEKLALKTKGEPVMAKAELLPKDILVDLEQGDRTELFLGVAENDASLNLPEGSIGAAFAQANQLGQAFANSSGSSFLSAQAMQQMLGAQQQLNAQRMSRFDPADPRNFQR